MSATFETDDRFVFTPGQKHGSAGFVAPISPGFNLALFAFQSLLRLSHFLFSGQAMRTPFAGLLLSVTLDLARTVFVLIITAYFVQVFWRRLIAALTPIRPIDYQEALAVVMMISILVGR